MHALGLVLIWTAIQVTVIFSITLVLLRLAGNSEPTWRSKIILLGMCSALLISACAVSPWPCWQEYWNAETAIQIEAEEPAAPDELQTPLPSNTIPNTTIKKADAELESPLSAALSAFVEELKTPRPIASESLEAVEAPKPAFSIASVTALIILCGAGFGLLRLFAGIWLLRREIARSRVLQDERVQSVIDKILASSKSRAIEVRITGRLRSAATTGVFRPVILLPVCWETWSEEELSAVLAHELNHIERRDCLTALFAELARVLHFYHPLMHWLANRLRLEQELAADAEAARFLGGQKRYLCILAEMALSESSRAPIWPARAFLPSHRTFLRRIEMLKKNPLTNRHVSRWSRCAVLALIGFATVFALGLRGTGNTATAQDANQPPDLLGAQKTQNAADQDRDRKPFPLTYVPSESVLVVGVRPKELFATPALKPLADLFRQNEKMGRPLGIPMDQIELVVWSTGMIAGSEPSRISMMLRASEKLNLEQLKQQLTPESDTAFYGGQLYLKQGAGPAFWLADEYTLIFSDSEEGLKRAIDARNLSVNRKNRIPGWESVSNQTIAAFGNIGLVRATIEGPGMAPEPGGFGSGMMPHRQPPGRAMGLNPMFGPLWSDVNTVVGSVSFDQGIQAKLTAHAQDQEGAAKVKETLDALLVLGRNVIDQNKHMISQLPKGEQEAVGAMLTIGQEVLKTLKVDKAQAKVVVDAKLPENTANLIVKALVPAVVQARTAAQRAKAMNQLKQIGIALHNYHDAHGKFPSPVMMGPDGKMPHSWRVAILPFIEEQELFNQYKFDEPWDSEHNKKLLAKMPDVFRHPMDKPDSTNASFFALVGKDTLMGDSESPAQIRNVTDGTSNTLMIVEAKREIPWTKPDDIPYAEDRSKPVPDLGGWFENGFLAVFGDGSVHFLAKTIQKTTLQNLIQRNDGQVINHEEFGGPLRRSRTGRDRTPNFDVAPPMGIPAEPRPADSEATDTPGDFESEPRFGTPLQRRSDE